MTAEQLKNSMQLRLFVEGDLQVVKLVRKMSAQAEYAGSTQAVRRLLEWNFSGS